MSATNLYEISSAPDFQEKLSQDLERVSVTNFWATWAVPCKEMNQVVEGLAAKYKTILFLQVNIVYTNEGDSTDIYHRLMQRNSQRFQSPSR